MSGDPFSYKKWLLWTSRVGLFCLSVVLCCLTLSHGVISHVFIGMSALSPYKESIDIAVVVLFPRGEEIQ